MNLKTSILLSSSFAMLMLAFFAPVRAYSQVTLPHYESFNYPIGDLISGSAPNWITTSGGGTNPIQVVNGSLTSPVAGLPAPIGNSVIYSMGGEDDRINFTAVTSGAVYVSFLADFSTAPDTLANGNYYIHLGDGSNTVFTARMFPVISGGNLSITVNNANNAATVQDITVGPLTVGTHFYVLKYEFQGGNAQISIFVDPNPALAEPSPTGTAAVGTLTQIGGVYLRQNNVAPPNSTQIDELRIGTAWADVMGGGGSPADDPNLVVSTSLDFGSIDATLSTTAGLIVQNSPSATINLNITSAPITGADAANFSIVTSPTLPLLANGVAGSTGTFVLQFDPMGSTGTFTADLTLNSNDPGDPAIVVALTGIAQDVISGTPILIITQIVDGDLNDAGAAGGSNPKGVEVTNVGDGSADLSLYSLNNANNGSTFDGSPAILSSGGQGFLDPGESIVLINTNDTVAYQSITGALGPIYEDNNTTNINGNDVIGLFMGTTLIDIYGVEGVDGVGQVWEYTDSFAYRVQGISSGSPTFNPNEWVFAGPSVLDGLDAAGHAALLGSGVAGSSPQLGFYPVVPPPPPTNISTHVKEWQMWE